jgi:hypothetical protein
MLDNDETLQSDMLHMQRCSVANRRLQAAQKRNQFLAILGAHSGCERLKWPKYHCPTHHLGKNIACGWITL